MRKEDRGMSTGFDLGTICSNKGQLVLSWGTELKIVKF